MNQFEQSVARFRKLQEALGDYQKTPQAKAGQERIYQKASSLLRKYPEGKNTYRLVKAQSTANQQLYKEHPVEKLANETALKKSIRRQR